MRDVLTLVVHGLAGLALTLGSTFLGSRSALAVYPEIMGCEQGCLVAAAGWPWAFVRDYPGMSVVNTVDIMEVWFAADRLDWLPFGADVAVWTLVSVVLFRASRSLFRR